MNNLEIYINGELAELSEQPDFTRVYRGESSVEEKKNNYSLTIKFPFTYKNDLIFKRSNSLSYKSDFPYYKHKCDVVANGVNLVQNGLIHLLSTTDSYECALTWDNIDYIGLILNNNTKLGALLYNFPTIPWNYEYDNPVIYDDSYNSTRALTYGYIRYNDGGGEFGGGLTHFYSYTHPMINFKYLLDLVIAGIGITVNIPTAKLNFLTSLILRPNKELDQRYNNVFKCVVRNGIDLVANEYALQLDYRYDGQEGIGSPAFGNNSYYFKTWIDTMDGLNDGLHIDYNNLGDIPQSKRFKAFRSILGNQMIVTNFSQTIGSNPIFIRWNAETDNFTTIATILGNGTYTFDCKEGDYLFFHTPITGDPSFDITITSVADEEATEPNYLFFPAQYHIPTNIDLTVGQFIQEALSLTGSILSYDNVSNQYSFKEKTKEKETAFNLTNYITSIKDITYDSKYVYNKLAQQNIFKYLNNTPVDADLNYSISDTRLQLQKIHVQLLTSPSAIQSGGYYNGFSVAEEHSFPVTEVWTQFTEQPLHLLFNDTLTSTVIFNSNLNWVNIFNLFYSNWMSDLESFVLSGTIRCLKINTNISDVEFKQINTKGIVYIATFSKYYSIIEIVKNGNDAEFFLLELF